MISPVFTNVSETWTLTIKDFGILDAFERKVLCKIIGLVCEKDGGEDRITIKFIKSQMKVKISKTEMAGAFGMDE